MAGSCRLSVEYSLTASAEFEIFLLSISTSAIGRLHTSGIGQITAAQPRRITCGSNGAVDSGLFQNLWLVSRLVGLLPFGKPLLNTRTEYLDVFDRRALCLVK